MKLHALVAALLVPLAVSATPRPQIVDPPDISDSATITVPIPTSTIVNTLTDTVTQTSVATSVTTDTVASVTTDTVTATSVTTDTVTATSVTTATSIVSTTPAPTIVPILPRRVSTTIWDTISTNPSFTNFTSLSQRFSPGLVARLDSVAIDDNDDDLDEISGNFSLPGTWTLFVPTDAAMASMIDSTLFRFIMATMNNNTITLAPAISRFLAYHVADRELVTSSVPPLGRDVRVDTLARIAVTVQRANVRPTLRLFLSPLQNGGNAIEIDSGNGSGTGGDTGNGDQVQETVYVNNAKILQPDVNASNGVIHVIDRALSPLSATIPSSLRAEAQPPVPGVETPLPVTDGASKAGLSAFAAIMSVFVTFVLL